MQATQQTENLSNKRGGQSKEPRGSSRQVLEYRPGKIEDSKEVVKVSAEAYF